MDGGVVNLRLKGASGEDAQCIYMDGGVVNLRFKGASGGDEVTDEVTDEKGASG